MRVALRHSVLELRGAADGGAVDREALWRGLLDGRARLVDRFSEGAARFLVFSPVAPGEAAVPRLTPREREVVDALRVDFDGRDVAARLGLLPSTAAAHRARALTKLGLGPHELRGFFDACGYAMGVGNRRWTVLILPSLIDRLPDDLSASERDVAALLVEGYSNAEIAERRGRSVRTVANQVGAIFRKLGVSGRGQLVAMLSESDEVESSRRGFG